MRWTKAYRVLRFIARNPDGVQYTDIVRFVLKMNKLKYTRERRGYWATNLLGSGVFGRTGILHDFCLKSPDGRWRINALVTNNSVLSPNTGRIVLRIYKRGKR